MSISTISSSITRTQKEVTGIHHKISLETRKESDLNNRIGQINREITKNTSDSMLKSKYAETERKKNEIAKIQVTKAGLHKKLTDKDGRLLKFKQDLLKEEDKERKKQALTDDRERKKLADLEKRKQKEQLDFQKKLQTEIQNTVKLSAAAEVAVENSQSSLPDTEYDLFISHASEDKDELVRYLAKTLENMGIKVWYDESTLKVGDSLRKSIDHGLVKSRFGTVILSASFFSKNWAQYELDSMVAREMNGHKMILPIWHKVTKNDVLDFSPALADKVALNTSLNSIEEIAGELADVIMPTKA